MTVMSMALDRLGEKNTERRETLLSLQADSQNAVETEQFAMPRLSSLEVIGVAPRPIGPIFDC